MAVRQPFSKKASLRSFQTFGILSCQLSFLLIYIYVLFVSCLFSLVLLFAVFAAVHFLAGIGQNKYLIQLLLNGGNAAGILTFDNIADFFRKGQCRLFYHFIVLYNIYCNIVIDKAQHIQINVINGALNFHNVLDSHLGAAGIFDNRHRTVQLVKVQVFVNLHALAGLDMIQYKPLRNPAYIQYALSHYTFTSSSVRIRAMRTYTPY